MPSQFPAFVGTRWTQVSVQIPTTIPQNKPLPLADWLELNNAYLPSHIAEDAHGLRGLLKNPTNEECICSIPRDCIVVADSTSLKNNQRPIDALAETLLRELELGEESNYFPYIDQMPSIGDLSLASIGNTWTDEQLDRLGHDATIQHFKESRNRRETFIKRNANASKDLAGLAFDLASSRALQGPFGQGGKVRAAVAGTMFAFIMAMVTPIINSGLSESILLGSTLPILPSVTVLVKSLANNQELAMLPWIDIANHKSKSRLYLQYGLLQDDIVLKRETTIQNAIGKPDFVHFDYGGSGGCSNDKLLGEYGFIEQDNPNDTIDIYVRGNAITLRRNGRTDNLTSDITIEELRRAARDTRNCLAAFGAADHQTTVDEIDTLRNSLASHWRYEKLRLLDEFLC
jgi:hypothetical protein